MNRTIKKTLTGTLLKRMMRQMEKHERRMTRIETRLVRLANGLNVPVK